MAGPKHLVVVVVALILGGLAGLAVALLHIPPYQAIERRVLQYGQHQPEDNDAWRQLAPLYANKPPAAVTLIGDSLTAYGDWPRLLPGVDVEGRGIPGDTTAGVLKRLKNGEPTGNTVFVLIGVNDLNKGLSLAESVANLRKILSLLHGKTVFLQSTILTKFSEQNERVQALDAEELRLCRTGLCRFVDLNSVMAKEGFLAQEFTVDGVHLSWAGYQAWATVIAPLASGAVRSPATDASRATTAH